MQAGGRRYADANGRGAASTTDGCGGPCTSLWGRLSLSLGETINISCSFFIEFRHFRIMISIKLRASKGALLKHPSYLVGFQPAPDVMTAAFSQYRTAMTKDYSSC